VRAHAKINLDLRVLGTRPDGFHELRTVFQAIALHDTVECVAREGAFGIECDVAGVPLDASNLVWRAADALWRSVRRSGPPTDVLIRLAKRIPLQAGLGGGERRRRGHAAGAGQAVAAADQSVAAHGRGGHLGVGRPVFPVGGNSPGARAR
jgi:4-diphosphocytidyl-2-C-methyl-D-erythritol kinase